MIVSMNAHVHDMYEVLKYTHAAICVLWNYYHVNVTINIVHMFALSTSLVEFQMIMMLS